MFVPPTKVKQGSRSISAKKEEQPFAFFTRRKQSKSELKRALDVIIKELEDAI